MPDNTAPDAMTSFIQLVAQARANRVRRITNEKAAPSVRTTENGEAPENTVCMENPDAAPFYLTRR
jgi:hypothetical protein